MYNDGNTISRLRQHRNIRLWNF